MIHRLIDICFIEHVVFFDTEHIGLCLFFGSEWQRSACIVHIYIDAHVVEQQRKNTQ